MNRIKQFLTARRISLGLILLVAGLMYVSTLIPQGIDAMPTNIETWRRGHESLLWLVDVANLHRMYAQPWFAATILFAALALGVSSCDQLIVARKKLHATGIGAGDEVAGAVPEQHLRAVARSSRYFFLRTGSYEQLKFVKNPWGYYGVLLLHLGMTLVITASLYVSLTGRQGALILVEGEEHDDRQAWQTSDHGILASELKLPGTIRLDKVRVRFDSKNQPVEVTSDLSITDASGRTDLLTAAINRISRYQGLRIYHAANYGAAFSVTFTDMAGVSHAEKIMVQQPVSLTTAGYSDDFDVTWSPYRFAAKYFADADNKSMLSSNPQLVVRVLDKEQELARTTVTVGKPGMLGKYRVELNKVEKWAKLIVVDITGMWVVFVGFAIIMLGGLIHYMTPPRELIGVRHEDGDYSVYWKAAAFREFFVEERDSVAQALNLGDNPSCS